MLVEEAPTEAETVFVQEDNSREMTRDTTAQATALPWVVVALALCAVGGLGFYMWNRSPTQLELYNTGDKPLLVRRGADDGKDAPVVVAPGGRYRAPYAAGDAVRLSTTAHAESSPETLVTLDFRRPTASDPPRVVAQAFADASGNVEFRYAESLVEIERLSREAALRGAFASEPAAPVTASAPARSADKFDASFNGEGRATDVTE